MGVLGNNALVGASAAGSGTAGIYPYQITNSLRLNGTSQALEKSFSSAASDDNKKAISLWIKRSAGGATNSAFGSTTNTKICSSGTGIGNVGDMLEINTNNPTGYSDQFHYNISGVGPNFYKPKWRDPASWIHIVWIFNSDESTTTDRLKVYINGESNTINDSTYWDNDGYNGYPSSGSDSTFGKSGYEMHIGRYVYDDAGWWGGQIADFIMIDGAASISDFGETNNGVWRPVDPSGLTFGNNGFWLKFTNASNPGEDFSGNDNDFTNIGSIPASASILDSPTFNSSSNGGNYCTLNPLFPDPTYARITNGNLQWGGSDGGGSVNEMGCMSTFAIHPSDTNIYYFEGRMKVGYSGGIEQSIGVNVPTVDLTSDRGGRPTAWCITNTDYRRIYKGDNSYDQYTGTGSAGDIIGVEIDRANTTIKFYINGALIGSATNLNTTTDLYPWVGTGGSTSDTLGWDLNFGQNGSFNGLATAQGETDATGYGNFYYDEANTCKAICSGNLLMSAQIDPAENSDDYPQKLFGATIWTGDGTTSRAITGLGFQPDWLWFKNRSSAFSNRLYDTTRGISSTGGKRLFSNTTGAETDQTSGQDISAVGTDGFTLGASSNLYTNDTNSGGLQVAWTWRANGGTTSTNATGDITSTVQADPSGGFSIFTYTGSGTSGNTVAHGLSQAPTMTIIKQRNSTNGWNVWATGYNSGDYDSFGELNTDGAWNANQGANGPYTAAPGATLLTLTAYGQVNGSSNTYVGYAFSDIEGYIKSGSYVGNANADGTFVYTGFKPAFFMCKPIVAGNWRIKDIARSPFNVTQQVLYPNHSNAEENYSSDDVDILSNGFKMRASDTTFNQATTYVYLAMAHNPFKYSLAR